MLLEFKRHQYVGMHSGGKVPKAFTEINHNISTKCEVSSATPVHRAARRVLTETPGAGGVVGSLEQRAVRGMMAHEAERTTNESFKRHPH